MPFELIRNFHFSANEGGLNPRPWPESHGKSKVKLPKAGLVLRWLTYLHHNHHLEAKSSQKNNKYNLIEIIL